MQFLKIHSFYILKQLPNCLTSFKLYDEIHTMAESCISVEINVCDRALTEGLMAMTLRCLWSKATGEGVVKSGKGRKMLRRESRFWGSSYDS